MTNASFEIIKPYGWLSEEKTGWRKELNLVAWNGRAPKLYIRDWSPDHKKMGKGLTLTNTEADKLYRLLAEALTAE